MDVLLPSQLVQKVIDELSRLPGIGRRTAMRLALFILKQDDSYALGLADSLRNMKENVKYCSVCHNISDSDICSTCNNPKRNKSIVCVIEDVRDFIAIEETGQYNGLYHILGGVISPINGISIDDLNIDSLVHRVGSSNEIKELVFALPTTVEGETTALYLYKKLFKDDLKISTIARGVAFGDDLEYTDQITLGRSIINRVAYQTQK